MRLEYSKQRSKSKSSSKMAGGGSSGNNRRRPYRLMFLLLALGIAVLSVVLLQKLRERRIFGLMLEDRDRQVIALQLLLQKEREHSKEMKRKLEDMKAKSFNLRTQQSELTKKLLETQSTTDHLKEVQREMEKDVEEKQNQINGLTEKAEESITANLRVVALTEQLKQKEAEIDDMKQRLTKLSSLENNTSSKDRQVIMENPENSSPSNATSEEVEVKVEQQQQQQQQQEISKEDQWVKISTNVDDDGFNDGGSDGGKNVQVKASEDRQSEKPKDSQENEHQSQGGEMSQQVTSEVKEQKEESENSEGNSNTTNDVEQGGPKDDGQEKLENSQSDQQQADAKSEEPKVRVRRGKTKSRSRKRRINRRGELEKHGDGQSYTSESNETLKARDEGADDSEKNVFEVGLKNTVSAKTQSDQGKGLEKEGQDDSNGIAEARHETVNSSDQKLENSDHHEDGESSKDGRSSVNEISHDGEGKEAKSTDEHQEKPETPQDDEGRNNDSENKARAGEDQMKSKDTDSEGQKEVIKEAADAMATSKMQQVIDGHQSQAIDTTENVSVGELKDDENAMDDKGDEKDQF